MPRDHRPSVCVTTIDGGAKLRLRCELSIKWRPLAHLLFLVGPIKFLAQIQPTTTTAAADLGARETKEQCRARGPATSRVIVAPQRLSLDSEPLCGAKQLTLLAGQKQSGVWLRAGRPELLRFKARPGEPKPLAVRCPLTMCQFLLNQKRQSSSSQVESRVSSRAERVIIELSARSGCHTPGGQQQKLPQCRTMINGGGDSTGGRLIIISGFCSSAQK